MSTPVTWLWVTGRDLDGVKRTNATWRHDATKVLIEGIDAGPWTRMRRRRRSAIRQAALIAIPAVAWDLRYHLVDTLALLAFLFLLLAVHAVYAAVERARLWQHNRNYVRPLEYALTPILGVPPAALEVNPKRTQAIVFLPEEFTAGEDGRTRQAITQAITAKVAIEAPDAQWHLQGRKPHVIYTQSEPPPPKVYPQTLSAAGETVKAAIEAAKEHEIVLGLGKKNALVKRSMNTDSPHCAWCMESGAGKSTAIRNVACQHLHHGGIVFILDIKMLSHMWADGLPNVVYAYTPLMVHQALCWLADDDDQESELGYRKRIGRAHADIRGDIQTDLGPEILVVAEEQNDTAKELKKLWRKMGGKGTPPSVDALDSLSFTGRQFRIRVHYVGQRLSAKATGGGSADSRENIGLWVFSNPKDSTWKLLGEGHAKPPGTSHKGRYSLLENTGLTQFQSVYWTEEEARDFATSGIIAQPHRDLPFTRHVAPVPGRVDIEGQGAPEQPFVVGPDASVLPPGPGPKAAVTLAEAVAAGVFVSISAARKAAQRRKWEPVGGDKSAGFTYALADLYEYKRSKEQR